MKKRVLSFWGDLLESLIIGVLVGALVGAYQLGMQYVAKGSTFMYQSRNPWVIVAMVVAVGVLSIANHHIVKNTKGVAGSGIPNIDMCIHNHQHTDWKKELPLMFVNSYLSAFVGFPLDAEGPSVVMAGKAAQMVDDIGSVDEHESVAMACGTGFGCAVLSPLAGLCYIFEECLKKINLKLIVRGLAMMVSAYFITSLINHHRLLQIEQVALLPFKNYFIFPLLVIANVLVGLLFVKGLTGAHKLLQKINNGNFNKRFTFALFAVMLVLNYLCLQYLGAGFGILENIFNYKSAWLILGVFALRYLLTVLAGAGRVTGGLVIPMMTLGALVGQAICLLCNECFGVSQEFNGVVILISMCMIFAVVNKVPLTAIALVYSVLGYSAGNYISVLQIMPMTAVAILVATFVGKLFDKHSLYHLLMEVDESLQKTTATEREEQPTNQIQQTMTEDVE